MLVRILVEVNMFNVVTYYELEKEKKNNIFFILSATILI